MSYFDAIVLGLVQGLTEFLPVSSSGHLVMAQTFLGVPSPGVFLEVALHVATLLSVMVVYRKRLGQLLGLHHAFGRFMDFQGGAYGMAILEAQCAGLPAVVGHTPGVAAIVADGTTGRVVRNGDAPRISNRSSLWQRVGDRWLLRFHQGTPEA